MYCAYPATFILLNIVFLFLILDCKKFEDLDLQHPNVSGKRVEINPINMLKSVYHIYANREAFHRDGTTGFSYKQEI